MRLSRLLSLACGVAALLLILFWLGERAVGVLYVGFITLAFLLLIAFSI